MKSKSKCVDCRNQCEHKDKVEIDNEVLEVIITECSNYKKEKK